MAGCPGQPEPPHGSGCSRPRENPVVTLQITFNDFGIGPLPKKLRVGLPSHIGTAVGGFGFSIRSSVGVSLAALVPQAVSKNAASITNRLVRRRNREETFFKGQPRKNQD